jgi:tetratricopeptide (TPR) repeat protein
MNPTNHPDAYTLSKYFRISFLLPRPMRQIPFLVRFSLVFIVISLANTEVRGNVVRLFDSANTLYTENNFEAAINIYEEIIAAGIESPELYFNLGNAYYRLNRLSGAILNYERALKLSPRDEDIRFNLDIARSHLRDRIEELPEFFLNRWLRNLSALMTTNQWALAGVFFFILLLFFLTGFLFTRSLSSRKALFVLILISAFFTLAAVGLSWIQKKHLTDRTQAIVTLPALVVKSSPDENSTDLFVIHEGTKLRITGELTDWWEIKLADGKKGWVKEGSFERI